MKVPNYKNRDVVNILSEHIYHDAQGFAFRAASWIDYVKRTGNFSALHYACIDGRLSIEHLVFQQLVLTSGEEFTEDEYNRCLNSPKKLAMLLKKIVPHYDKLLEFSEIVASLSPGAPQIIRWDIKGLMKLWGKLSNFLHWTGSSEHTTESSDWQRKTINTAAEIIEPLWLEMSQGRSGCMNVRSMPDVVRNVWEDFATDKIDADSCKIRLEIVRPNSSR